eukprot:SAG25_NODE_4005_length_909_cov_1.200000_1_plen_64_part_01
MHGSLVTRASYYHLCQGSGLIVVLMVFAMLVGEGIRAAPLRQIEPVLNEPLLNDESKLGGILFF